MKVKDLVFLDNFGATPNLARTRARGPKGQRAVCKTAHGHWKSISTIAAMTVSGILTTVSYDAAVNTDAFVGLVEQFLLPTLSPGQLLMLDNLPAHKSKEVDRLVESVGARVLRLPPTRQIFIRSKWRFKNQIITAKAGGQNRPRPHRSDRQINDIGPCRGRSSLHSTLRIRC